jgi:hypothetical protein
LAAWIGGAASVVSGHAEMAGMSAVGEAASEDGSAWTRILALLMTQSLLLVSIVHTVILAADARSRARYHASSAGVAAS